MLLSGDKAATWARPAGRIGDMGHWGELMQRLAAAGGLLRAWGELRTPAPAAAIRLQQPVTSSCRLSLASAHGSTSWTTCKLSTFLLLMVVAVVVVVVALPVVVLLLLLLPSSSSSPREPMIQSADLLSMEY